MTAMKMWAIVALGFTSQALAGNADGKLTCGDLHVPAEVVAAIRKESRGWNLVTIADLGPEDKRAWAEAHGDQCPGFVKGRFGPFKGPQYAVTLLKKTGGMEYQKLIFLRRVKKYKSSSLSSAESVSQVSVVTKTGPGEVIDHDRNKIAVSKFDLINYEVIGAGVITFYWKEGRFFSVTTSE